MTRISRATLFLIWKKENQEKKNTEGCGFFLFGRRPVHLSDGCKCFRIWYYPHLYGRHSHYLVNSPAPKSAPNVPGTICR